MRSLVSFVNEVHPSLSDCATRPATALSIIVSDFLAFGRPRRPQFAAVDLEELIDETWSLLTKDDRCPDGIELARGYEAAPLPVRADRDQLRQVFWNLFLNAVQAMREEGTLGVETERIADRVEVRVWDTGPGIPPAILPKVFEPFVTTNPSSGGTGLGLSIARWIALKHAGNISLHSPGPAQGATVVVLLPLSPAPKS